MKKKIETKICDKIKMDHCDDCYDSSGNEGHSSLEHSSCESDSSVCDTNTTNCSYYSCEKSCDAPAHSGSSECDSDCDCDECDGDDCDGCDDSSCDSSEEPDCCPDDCPDKCCRPFNIHWFGSIYTDIGNGRLNLGIPEPNKTEEIPLPEECGTIKDAAGPCGRPSNGKVYPQFVGEDLCYEVINEYDLACFPQCSGNLISYAITDSMQVGNLYPVVPNGEYGYSWQVDRYLELYAESECYSFPEKDVFMYSDVGANELINYLKLVLLGQPLPPNYWDEFVANTYNNIYRLFNEGKARRMFIQLADLQLIEFLPAYPKLNCAIPQLANILSDYDQALEQLIDQVSAFAATYNFDVTFILEGAMYEHLQDNAFVYGISPSPLPTMVDLGWPDRVFENAMWFDDLKPTEHTNRVTANFVKTWFQQKVCDE